MANTALNRTVVSLLTNKSGGDLAYGDTVIIDTANAKSFTTTTTSGYATTGVGVIIEPNGIASNAIGLVATAGWVPKVTLNTAATIGQFIKTHTVAGQSTPHGTQATGDFGYALQASATPECILFGGPNHPATGATVADADYGDITVSASGATWTIDNDVVTYAKMQNISATSRLLGRKTAAAGDTEECTLSEALDFVGSAAQGDILYRGAATWTRLGAGTSGQFLKTQGAAANPVWATASGGGGGSAESIYEFDDFITNESTTQYKFFYSFGSAPSILTPEANHPGMIRLSTGVGGNSMNPCATAARSFLPADTFTLTFVVRPNGHANADYQVGARGATAWPTNEAIFVEALTTDTNWFLVTRTGGTSTRVDTGIAISNATWYKITLYRKDASTIGATVNAGAEVTSTTNIPTAALDPFAQLIVASGTQTYDIDYWSFADTISARY